MFTVHCFVCNVMQFVVLFEILCAILGNNEGNDLKEINYQFRENSPW